MRFGPSIHEKPPMPKFKAKLKLPKMLNRKKLMNSERKLGSGMMKGIRHKSLMPRKNKIVL